MGGGAQSSQLAALFGAVPFLAIGGLLFVLLRLPAWIDAHRARIFSCLARCALNRLPLLDGLGWLDAESCWPVSGWVNRVASRLEAGAPLDRAMEGGWIGLPFFPDAIPIDDRRLLARTAAGVPVEIVLAALAGRYQGRMEFAARMRRHVSAPLYAIFAIGTLSVCAAMSVPTVGFQAALSDITREVAGFDQQRLGVGGVVPVYALAAVTGALLAAFFAPRSRLVRQILGRLPFTRFLIRDLEWIELGRRLSPALAAGRTLEAALADLGDALPLATTRTSVARWREGLVRGAPLREALASTTAPATWKSLVVAGTAAGGLRVAIDQANDYLESLLSARLGLCEQLGCAAIALLSGVAVGAFVHRVFATLLALAEWI